MMGSVTTDTHSPLPPPYEQQDHAYQQQPYTAKEQPRTAARLAVFRRSSSRRYIPGRLRF